MLEVLVLRTPWVENAIGASRRIVASSRHIFRLFRRCDELFAKFALHFARMSEDIVQRPVLVQQAHGGFVADAGDAGTSSLLSPASPFQSTTCSGEKPYTSYTMAGVKCVVSLMPLRVNSTCVVSDTSWSASRLPVRMTGLTRRPRPVWTACRADRPPPSLAGRKPGCPFPAAASEWLANCWRSSSGVAASSAL